MGISTYPGTKGEFYLLFFNVKTGEHFFAVRKGRGPGEMVQGTSLHKNGKYAYFYAIDSGTCIRIMLEESVIGRKLCADTVGHLANGMSRPGVLTRCGEGGFVSCNLMDDSVWYSYYDESGKILSSVDALKYENIPAKDKETRISNMASSQYASSPDGSKVCVVNLPSASISFSDVKAGQLSEYKRYEMPPVGLDGGGMTPEHRGAFTCVDADESYVYVTYSGNRHEGDALPSYECNHLIVYDWSGKPVHHYVLSHNINCVSIDGDTIVGASISPESVICRYRIRR